MGARSKAASGVLIIGVLMIGVLVAACGGTEEPPDTASTPGTSVSSFTPALTSTLAPAAPDPTTSATAPPGPAMAGSPAARPATAPATASALPTAGTGAEHEASTVRLSPGEQAAFAGWTVVFLAVTDDSRCPVDVVCVWAGEVVLALTVHGPSGSAVTREVRFQGEPVEIALQAGLALSIEGVEPAPRSTSVIAAGDYVVSGRWLAAR